MGELPALVLTSTNVHGRPSIAGVNTSDVQDTEDKSPAPPAPVVDSSTNKSPVNAGGGECWIDCNVFDETRGLYIFHFLSQRVTR